MTDHRIFAKLTQHWENEFHEDMKALNVCVHHQSIVSCRNVYPMELLSCLDIMELDVVTTQ